MIVKITTIFSTASLSQPDTPKKNVKWYKNLTYSCKKNLNPHTRYLNFHGKCKSK